MKFAFLLLFTGLVQARSVVPPRVVYPNLNIFEKAKNNDDGTVTVKAVSYDEFGRFTKNDSKVTLSAEQYETFKTLSMPVFRMIPDPNYPNGEDRQGTAFSIGENLVLTNNHVLDREFKNTTSCADFQVKNNEGHTFDCKKVHFCHVKEDVCLIEMRPTTIRKKDCAFCRSEKIEVSLADGPSLKLKAHYSPLDPDKEVTTAIGNSGAWGIHISQGRGIGRNKYGLLFWAPIRGGNSGGPLLNDENLVIGIVKAETPAKRSQFTNFVYNIATDSETIIKVMREGIKDPETLEKFNRSVVE
ncbi:serine protease [Peredibacter sp. HCB2-198]|uniref:S1 family peptidase n=1 Tax=Peredibacter sp. HCB2-198 TaxID=3383025 RepID=UPI0038B4C7A5